MMRSLTRSTKAATGGSRLGQINILATGPVIYYRERKKEQIKMENKMVQCSSCGAQFEAALVRCPYCGSAHAMAEEEEYMGQLEDIREDLEEHGRETEKRLKKGLGRLFRTVMITVTVIVLLVLLIFWISSLRERSKARERKAEFLTGQGITTQQESAEE